MNRQRGFIEWFLVAPGIAAFLLVGMLALSAGAEGAEYRYDVAGFYTSPVGSAVPRSKLRFVNPADSPIRVEIHAWDSDGEPVPGSCSGELVARSTLHLKMEHLRGSDLRGGDPFCSPSAALDPPDPAQRPPVWFLVVTADQPLLVQHLVWQWGVWRDFSVTARAAAPRWGAIWAVPSPRRYSVHGDRVLNYATESAAEAEADRLAREWCASSRSSCAGLSVRTFSECGALVQGYASPGVLGAFIGVGPTHREARDAALRLCRARSPSPCRLLDLGTPPQSACNS